MGQSIITTDEILLHIDGEDKEARRRLDKKREEELRIKREEDEQRKREEQILDYSAKVDGGFIEVKIGEDIEAMRQAWELHEKKRNQAFDQGLSEKQIDAMGLKTYTWEEWKRYYRKMHGLPEDGIKRIPFEGKRKERQIDRGVRHALSKEELGKYGVTMSRMVQ